MAKSLLNKIIKADPRDSKQKNREHRTFIYLNEIGEDDRISLAQAMQKGDATLIKSIKSKLKIK